MFGEGWLADIIWGGDRRTANRDHPCPIQLCAAVTSHDELQKVSPKRAEAACTANTSTKLRRGTKSEHCWDAYEPMAMRAASANARG